jgi:hypothetical protein
MTSIKQVLMLLTEADRATLRYAFENELTNQYVVWTKGRFIGVRISLASLRVEQEAGLYAEGSLISGSNGHV